LIKAEELYDNNEEILDKMKKSFLILAQNPKVCERPQQWIEVYLTQQSINENFDRIFHYQN
jgi:hypothetical protein